MTSILSLLILVLWNHSCNISLEGAVEIWLLALRSYVKKSKNTKKNLIFLMAHESRLMVDTSRITNRIFLRFPSNSIILSYFSSFSQ